MLHRLTRFAPPGMETKGWKDFTIIVLAGNIVFSLLVFFMRISWMLAELPEPDMRMLPGVVTIWDFPDALGKSMTGFPIFAVSMVAFVVMNYLYFFEGSKSVYTMARLKNPWELHLRCWALPLYGAAALLLCRVALTVIYFLIFVLATPKDLGMPEWHQLLRGLLL